MYCVNCGKSLNDDAIFCVSCGDKTKIDQQTDQPTQTLKIGYSPKINDPAFARYIKNTNKWAASFSLILAVAAIVGFYISGETSSEMDNPESLYIGLGIASMFLLIAFFQIIGRNRSKTWDGVVENKTVKKKTRTQTSGDDHYTENYLEYTITIKSDSGKKHTIRVINDDTHYHFYQIGDRVRHHKGLNSYEKYDKSNDTFLFCNACASKNDLSAENCFRCKCPLLK